MASGLGVYNQNLDPKEHLLQTKVKKVEKGIGLTS